MEYCELPGPEILLTNGNLEWEALKWTGSLKIKQTAGQKEHQTSENFEKDQFSDFKTLEMPLQICQRVW